MDTLRMLIIGTALATVLASAGLGAQVKIMPLGDSITYRSGKDSKDKVQNYRYPLFKQLIDERIPFDYVGRNGDEYVKRWPGDYPDYKGIAFDGDNEGYRGAPYASIISKLQSVPSNMAPDWLLCYGGANDVREGNVPLDACLSVFKAARSKNPNVVIFLGLLASCTSSSTLDKLNKAQVQYCKENSTAQSPIYAVDFGNVGTVDGCHANSAGASTMASGWMKAIREHLAANGTVGAVLPASQSHFVRQSMVSSRRGWSVQDDNAAVFDLSGRLVRTEAHKRPAGSSVFIRMATDGRFGNAGTVLTLQ